MPNWRRPRRRTRSSRLSSIGKCEAEAGGSPADEFNMKSKVRLYTLIGLLSIAASVRAADETQATWPPPHMKGLPAEYQARQRRALETQLETISKLRPGVNPVLWVRFGIAGLALEKHVDQINAYIEDDSFEYKPSDKFGFSLFSSPYVRLYALFNDRTGAMKGRLSPKAQANLVRVRFG